jgi:chromosome segregation ATPase
VKSIQKNNSNICSCASTTCICLLLHVTGALQALLGAHCPSCQQLQQQLQATQAQLASAQAHADRFDDRLGLAELRAKVAEAEIRQLLVKLEARDYSIARLKQRLVGAFGKK